ncbi:MobP3 family relaxase [Symbiobacterium terraclitae]|uniref:MobP3 family relaxase n=1 Tax=Symbiobacterium terraclitae TaxID=557451 RepID=UPI0035B561E7
MRPVVLKLSTGGSADKAASGQRNASHIKYISTHGALTPDQAQREANAAHIVYQATHGALFDEEGGRLIGNAAEAGEEAARREALEHEGHQWRWVLSLHGNDADALGYRYVADWHRLARQVVPALAAEIGIQPEHLRWVAAHHDPTPALGGDRHPHLHIAMWSAVPLNRPHRLTRDELRACRRAVVTIVRGPYRTRLAAEKTTLREAIRAAGAQTLGEMLAAARALRVRPARLVPEDLETLDRMLRDLAGQMPGRGRAAVAYLPAPVKAQVYAATDWLLNRPQLAAQVSQYRAVARELAALYVADPVKLVAAETRAYEDLRHRVAQFVVRAAADLNRDMRLAAAFGGTPDPAAILRNLVDRVGHELSRPQTPASRPRSLDRDGRSRDGRSTDGRGRD